MTYATLQYYDSVFFDKKVQTLNEKLNELRWISSLYPIAWVGQDEEGTYPEVYYNDGSGKNIRVLPAGNAISFFQIDGDMTEVDEFHFLINLSLFVWADLRKVYPTKNYDYTSELIKDIVTVLRENSCNDLVISTDQALDEFTYLAKTIHQNTMRPYTAFKVSFSCIITTC